MTYRRRRVSHRTWPARRRSSFNFDKSLKNKKIALELEAKFGCGDFFRRSVRKKKERCDLRGRYESTEARESLMFHQTPIIFLCNRAATFALFHFLPFRQESRARYQLTRSIRFPFYPARCRHHF